MIIGLLCAVAATVLNTIAGLLESRAARTSSRRPLPLRPRYVVGLVVDGAGWVCTVAALQRLPVLLVQAVLSGTIVLTADRAGPPSCGAAARLGAIGPARWAWW